MLNQLTEAIWISGSPSGILRAGLDVSHVDFDRPTGQSTKSKERKSPSCPLRLPNPLSASSARGAGV